MRRRAKAKTFAIGELVRVCPTSDHSPRPEQFVEATYKGKIADWRGWHRVEVTDHAHGRYIDRSTGMVTTADNAGAFHTRTLSVPTQRIRKARPT